MKQRLIMLAGKGEETQDLIVGAYLPWIVAIGDEWCASAHNISGKISPHGPASTIWQQQKTKLVAQFEYATLLPGRRLTIDRLQ